jgi:hypothetical protein
MRKLIAFAVVTFMSLPLLAADEPSRPGDDSANVQFEILLTDVSGVGDSSERSIQALALGDLPELIEPGEPQQNGRHERMHRTLKRETTRPSAATLRSQQNRFQQFQQEYNDVRPHEALDQETPGIVLQDLSSAVSKAGA